MDQMRKFFPFLTPKIRKEQAGRLSFYYKNGSLLLEDLIASFGGHYKLPLCSFAADEIIKATKNFSDRVRQSKHGDMFTGNLQERPVLVKFYKAQEEDYWWNRNAISKIIRDIVMTSQMSHLKNVLQLIGCCLEFEFPAMVYGYAPGIEFLDDQLSYPMCGGKEVLTWGSRLKIASDISNVLLYLHTAFPTPIIFGSLTIKKVVIDECGVAKLFDFGFCVSLPPGELEMENPLRWADMYSDPQSFKSIIVTQKTDVYSLGIFMFMLLTGETETVMYPKGLGRLTHIREYVKGCLESDQFNQIVDPKIIEEEYNDDHELKQQLLAFLDLALRCTEDERIVRPYMIDVAKELHQMEKSIRGCPFHHHQ